MVTKEKGEGRRNCYLLINFYMPGIVTKIISFVCHNNTIKVDIKNFFWDEKTEI